MEGWRLEERREGGKGVGTCGEEVWRQRREAGGRRDLSTLPMPIFTFTAMFPAPRRRPGTWEIFDKYLFQTLRQRKAIWCPFCP